MKRLVLLTALAVGACGVKSRPLPPELVQPLPPTSLVAKSTAEGIQLTWRRPTEYSGGKAIRDLAGFDVERATGADGVDFARVGTVELTDQTRFQKEKTASFTDTAATPGASYRYRIVARTLDRYRSVPSEPVMIEHTTGRTAEAPPTPPQKRPKKKRAPR